MSARAIFLWVVAGVVMATLALMLGIPPYRLWQQGLEGAASMRRAEQTRHILVIQAQAEADAAVLRAQAIATVGKASQDFPQYRQQEFIGAFAEALHSGRIQQIVYVPTEAMIPIMEAGRMAPVPPR